MAVKSFAKFLAESKRRENAYTLLEANPKIHWTFLGKTRARCDAGPGQSGRSRIESVAVQIIVITNINCRAWIWRPAQQQLSKDVCRKPIVVQLSAHKQITREQIIRVPQSRLQFPGAANYQKLR